MTLRLLHVEDEPNARHMLRDLLPDAVDLTSVGTAEEALEACRAGTFDLTLLDWTLPGMDGGAFLRAVRQDGRAGRVVVLTAMGTTERAIEAMRAGAYDFLVKPADPDALLDLVERASRSAELIRGASRSRPVLERAPAAAILGSSPEVLDLKARLELIAAADASVLIVGESGTGKELVARSLHESSGRHRSRLVTVNCAAIPETLFESELFGHKRGAFTGASADRAGLVELASGGTLFLDEVGELTPQNQAKLLRVLQEGQVRRVGDDRLRAVDVRVIAATNRDLELEVEAGTFREDLLFRLDVIRLEVPPLRERRGDLAELLDHFLTQHLRAYDRPALTLSAAQRERLERHPWPGNIRELENTAKRIALLGPDLALAELERRGRRPSDATLPAPAATAPDAAPRPEDVLPLRDAIRNATRDAILHALRACAGSRTQAAQVLGVSRKTLFNKMQELGIKEESSWS
ncbi:MAG: sigma-54-dependent transcriptional regulator [Planctomycetota bacterium]